MQFFSSLSPEIPNLDYNGEIYTKQVFSARSQ